MTEVRVRRAPDGSITEIAVSGHAGYADYGQDIVCAAISALAQTAVIGLREVARHPFEEQVRSGFLRCRIKPGGTPDSFAKAQAILETTVLGLKDIAEGYPDYLRVTEGG